jgi:hypothetical protein
MTRKLYDKIGGLYQLSILGSGDFNMAFSLIRKGPSSVNSNNCPTYPQSIKDFQDKIYGARLGYVPGIIRHYFHGTKENRKYNDRWKILVQYQYDPTRHITINSDGLLIPTPECPQGLLDDILQYSKDRKEDD